MTEKFIKALGAITFFALVLFVAATLGGTVLWLIYSHIHVLFPTAAAKGIIAQDLGWWDSVCIVWIFSLIIKSSGSSSEKKS